MNPDPLCNLLEQRDQLIAGSPELAALWCLDEIENEEIRELGKIVLETTNEEMTMFSTT